jgi:hypothetical protein
MRGGNFSAELGFFIIVRATAAILALGSWKARDVHKSLISPSRGKTRQAERESFSTFSLPFLSLPVNLSQLDARLCSSRFSYAQLAGKFLRYPR